MWCVMPSRLGSTHYCTDSYSLALVSGPLTSFRIGPQGSQKSFQKLIDSPLLTIHLRPFTYTGPLTLHAV